MDNTEDLAKQLLLGSASALGDACEYMHELTSEKGDLEEEIAKLRLENESLQEELTNRHEADVKMTHQLRTIFGALGAAFEEEQRRELEDDEKGKWCPETRDAWLPVLLTKMLHSTHQLKDKYLEAKEKLLEESSARKVLEEKLERFDNMKLENEALGKKVSQLNAEKKELQQELEDAVQTQERTKTLMLDGLERTRLAAREAVQKLNNEKDEMKRDTSFQLTGKDSEITRLKEAVRKLTFSLDAEKSRVTELQTILTQTEGSNDAISKHAKALEQQVETLKQSHEETLTHLRTAERKLEIKQKHDVLLTRVNTAVREIRSGKKYLY